MIMIENKSTGKVLVLDRRGSWPGLTFPGGHVEKGEPFYDAAVREAKEETGLDVSDLRLCGIVHWGNRQNGDCYLEFLYKTSRFYGALLPETVEGSIFWMSPEELKNSDRLSPKSRQRMTRQRQQPLSQSLSTTMVQWLTQSQHAK